MCGRVGLDKSHCSEKGANMGLRFQELCPGLLLTVACCVVGKEGVTTGERFVSYFLVLS